MAEMRSSDLRSSRGGGSLMFGLLIGGLIGLIVGGILTVQGSELKYGSANLVIDQSGGIYPLVQPNSKVSWYVWGTGSQGRKVSHASDIRFPGKSPCVDASKPLADGSCTVSSTATHWYTYVCAPSDTAASECDPNMPIGSWNGPGLVQGGGPGVLAPPAPPPPPPGLGTEIARAFVHLLSIFPGGKTASEKLDEGTTHTPLVDVKRPGVVAPVQSFVSFDGTNYKAQGVSLSAGSNLEWLADDSVSGPFEVSDSPTLPTLSTVCDTQAAPFPDGYPPFQDKGQAEAGVCHLKGPAQAADQQVYYRVCSQHADGTNCAAGSDQSFMIPGTGRDAGVR